MVSVELNIDRLARVILISAWMFLLFTSNIMAQHKTAVYITDFPNESLRSKIEKNASELLTALNSAYMDTTSKEPDFSNVALTDIAKNAINAIWSTAKFQCTETEIITNLIREEDGSGYEIRNIPFVIKVSKDSVRYEDGVLLFTPTGIVKNLFFGLETRQYNKLLRTGKDITDFRRRQLILNFIENFRTAYNRKDLDFLTKVFSDNALIIVGQVIKEKPKSSDMLEKNLGKQKVKLIRYSKKEYLSHLKEVFRRNEYIDVGFEGIDIVQHRLFPNIYGAQMKQYWKSSTYSDVGYLFLMIDFKDENNPVIHVRAWQPEKETDPDSAISLGDFEIIQ